MKWVFLLVFWYSIMFTRKCRQAAVNEGTISHFTKILKPYFTV